MSLLNNRLLARLQRFLTFLSKIAAIVCLVAVIIYAGFDHLPSDRQLLSRIVRACQWLFFADILFEFSIWIRNRQRPPRNQWFRIVLQILVLLTIIPLLYPHPLHPWIPFLEAIAYSNRVVFSILSIYCVVEISDMLMRVPNRHTNPSLLLSTSFILLIIIGALLLLLPRSTVEGISVVDAFFVSTSAVCITGLTSVDVATTFTPMGQVILALLIETGGLGVLTFTFFFALFFTGSQSIYSQLLVRDVVYSKTMSALLPTMLYILGFTIVIELVGAIGLYFSIPAELGFDVVEKIRFSIFHSISAFCNAGFSTLPDGFSNVILMKSDQSIYWVTSFIVILGAVSFPLLVNVKDAIATRIFRHKHAERDVHIFNMNSRIVAAWFFALFVFGAVVFFFLEYDNTLAGMNLWEKLSQSVFNSTTPRSSGFISVAPSDFMPSTLLIVMFLMWIGGAAQSTAGGIKVNTLAAVVLNLRAIIGGRRNATAYNRRIAPASIRRANAVVAISIFSLVFYILILLLFDSGLSTRSLVFEAASALFTVGSSFGITSELSVISKVALCTAMLLGRVGIISIFMGMSQSHGHDISPHLPEDNLIIN